MRKRQGSKVDDEKDDNGIILKKGKSIDLKLDHEVRPLWISNDLRIVLGNSYLLITEAFSPLAKEAQDLLIAIAEPVTRPKNMHEYRLTEYSLYAAISVGLDTNAILEALEKFSKSKLTDEVESFIRSKTKSYAKVKLVLKDNQFWVESQDEVVLTTLLNDSVISSARVGEAAELATIQQEKETSFVIPVAPETEDTDLLEFFDDDPLIDDIDPDAFFGEGEYQIQQDALMIPAKPTDADVIEEVPVESQQMHAFQVRKDSIEIVKKRCTDLTFPLLEEYDYQTDVANPILDIDLKPKAKLRPYQEKCLGKMFGNGRARSGIIVLPCGSGKTLVGVTAACTIKKSVLVLCNSSLSVEQWAREFKYWSTIKDGDVAKFSSECKERFSGDAGILISTYTMIAYSGKRAYDAQKMMEFIQSREWDEVHVAPADMFRKTLTIVSAHAKLGLTATLVREDEKIQSLNWLIGPKLYEVLAIFSIKANWMELADNGYIANVQCAEVWCKMATPFYREYLRAKARKRQLLYVMNPGKIQSCQYLIAMHEAMGDKIIVFSDNIFAIKHYAEKLGKPYIYGGTSQSERMRVLQQFRFNPALNTIFLSKVGDTSIDLPEATCLIQISSQYGSRRQEAQRLGRILRPKKGGLGKANAFFYSLVSSDTEEMYYATKRQQFLVDQGYEFKIITNLVGEREEMVYCTLQEQLSLLNTVLLSSESDLVEDGDEDVAGDRSDEDESDVLITRRTTNTLSSLSGSDSMAYLEYKRGTTSGLAKKVFTKRF